MPLLPKERIFRVYEFRKWLHLFCLSLETIHEAVRFSSVVFLGCYWTLVCDCECFHLHVGYSERCRGEKFQKHNGRKEAEKIRGSEFQSFRQTDRQLYSETADSS